MAQQGNRRPQSGDTEYEETVDPKNPPSSVLQRKVRNSTLAVFLGGIVLLFAIVGFVWVYWVATRPPADRPGETADAVGTIGSEAGGHDPRPRFGKTEDEIKFRGDPAQGSPAGATSSETILAIGDVVRASRANIGRAVDLRNVQVTSVNGSNFKVTDGNDTAFVIAPSGAPTLTAGQRVDVRGTVESDGGNGVHIKSTRVDVKD